MFLPATLTTYAMLFLLPSSMSSTSGPTTVILWSSTSLASHVCTSSAQSTREPSNSTCMSLRRIISPSNADAKATGISMFVILILMSRASREVAFHLEMSFWQIRLFGTLATSSWFVITGNPRAIAPAPQATITSFNGANALTNAGTRFIVYSIRVAASPGFTLPKIRAARSATDTTWITAVTSFPSGITRTLAPVLYPTSSNWSITSPTRVIRIP